MGIVQLFTRLRVRGKTEPLVQEHSDEIHHSRQGDFTR